jgi:hypothetical protein
MSGERLKPAASPCPCNVLRQATRAVSRLYDEELRGIGLRATQYPLLRRLRAARGVRQRDLGGLTSLDETTLTRNLSPLIDAGWVAIRPGEERCEKLVRLNEGELSWASSMGRRRWLPVVMAASGWRQPGTL